MRPLIAGLSAILELTPIKYTWKEESGLDTKNIYSGFSAQNVQDVIPEAVNKDNKGYLALSDRPITCCKVAVRRITMKLLKITFIVIAFGSAFALQQRADERFALKNSVLGNGGNVLTTGDYRVVGTLGQPFIGVAQSPSNANHVGFWYLSNPMPATSVEQTMSNVPTEFQLEQNYPNPFNPETRIHFQLPQASKVVVRIFNLLGQEVRTLADKQYEAGFHAIPWDGKANNGRRVASGIYLYQLQAGSFSQVKKMTLLR